MNGRSRKTKAGRWQALMVVLLVGAVVLLVSLVYLQKPPPPVARHLPEPVDANGCYRGLAVYVLRTSREQMRLRTGATLRELFESVAERSVETKDEVVPDPPPLACVEQCWVWSRTGPGPQNDALFDVFRRCLERKGESAQERAQATAYLQQVDIRGDGNAVAQKLVNRMTAGEGGVDGGSAGSQTVTIDGSDNQVQQHMENETVRRGTREDGERKR